MIRARLAEASALLANSQSVDGTWNGNWIAAGAKSKTNSSRWEALTATGHHLEWIVMAPPELRPPEDRIIKALAYLVAFSKTLLSHQETDFFLPMSHAARAVCLLRGESPAELLDE